MKKLLPFFILLFTFSVFAQEKTIEDKIKTFANAKRFQISYDKFKDKTTIQFGWFNVSGSKENQSNAFFLSFGAAFAYAGQAPAQPENYTLWFSSSTSKWAFLDRRHLIFLVDGERIDIGDGNRSGKVSSGRYVSVTEAMSYVISATVFQKIANGKSVEFQLGKFTAALKAEHTQMLKDIQSLTAIEDKPTDVKDKPNSKDGVEQKP